MMDLSELWRETAELSRLALSQDALRAVSFALWMQKQGYFIVCFLRQQFKGR